jgi:hypothetical protein
MFYLENIDSDSSKCPMGCILCGEPCSSPDLNHDDRATVLNQIGHPLNGFKLHLCNSRHPCMFQCSKGGHKASCQVNYTFETKNWNSFLYLYPYVDPMPTSSVNRCSVMLPQHAVEHQGKPHDCLEKHTCYASCPDCD